MNDIAIAEPAQNNSLTEMDDTAIASEPAQPHNNVVEIDDIAITEPANLAEVNVIFGAKVVDIDLNTCSVTLHSGTIYKGDVVIGADGAGGTVRQLLMREEAEAHPAAPKSKSDVPTGLSVYRYAPGSLSNINESNLTCSAIIPEAVGVQDPELAKFYKPPQVSAVVVKK